MRTLTAVLVLLLLGSAALAAEAVPGVVVRQPELTVLRHGGNESIALPGGAYRDFVVTETGASFIMEDSSIPAGSKTVRGGAITEVSWQPGEDGTRVDVTFSRAPESSLINALPGTELRPGVPQVIAGFNFKTAPGRMQQRPAAGRQPSSGVYGEYELPGFPKARYSDALVTLNVQNVDFRDVLWLMSGIGNVSIVLDPYWNDEPTGSRRTVGGGATGDGGSSGGHGGPSSGFKPGGEFVPSSPREGTGNLTMNLQNVPFDLALDLVLQSVGLVKVDVYPGTLR